MRHDITLSTGAAIPGAIAPEAKRHTTSCYEACSKSVPNNMYLLLLRALVCAVICHALPHLLHASEEHVKDVNQDAGRRYK
jgi:hypothetical protein